MHHLLSLFKHRSIKRLNPDLDVDFRGSCRSFEAFGAKQDREFDGRQSLLQLMSGVLLPCHK